jgi:hypothetical protein
MSLRPVEDSSAGPHERRQSHTCQESEAIRAGWRSAVDRGLASSFISATRRHRTPILLGALWYLMIPPTAGQSGVNSTAPLASWTKAGTYSSLNDCASAKNSMVSMFIKTAQPGESRTQGLMAIEHANCVGSDDYRLEGSQPSPTGGAGGWSSPQ